MRRRAGRAAWGLFTAGGTVAALLVPAHLLIGLISGHMLEVPLHPVAAVYVLLLVALPLFHAAHRVRYALYDATQQEGLDRVLAMVGYGATAVATAIAAWALWRLV